MKKRLLIITSLLFVFVSGIALGVYIEASHTNQFVRSSLLSVAESDVGHNRLKAFQLMVVSETLHRGQVQDAIGELDSAIDQVRHELVDSQYYDLSASSQEEVTDALERISAFRTQFPRQPKPPHAEDDSAFRISPVIAGDQLIGVRLVDTSQDGPVRKLGISIRDVIVSVDGRDITDPDDILRLESALDSGSPVELGVDKDGVVSPIRVPARRAE